jgi:hypothetical protein
MRPSSACHRHLPMNRFLGLTLVLILTLAACATPQETVLVTDRPIPPPTPEAPPADERAIDMVDTVTVGRFDYGKMWTFENPPLEYFDETYGFRPDDAWFTNARLGALRFSTYCSASFVSPNGLILTNNHCGRESVEAVSETGEGLLEVGFYARDLGQERRVEDLHVDQLIDIADVTDRVVRGIDRVGDASRRAQMIEQRIEELQNTLTREAQARDSSLTVEIISLYRGGRYGSYMFRRYDDVRLVFVTEHRIGYFGGDPDNFTYPRYNLDYAFFRAYDQAGAPLRSQPYFRWSTDELTEGTPVFVIGNPGSTSRLLTVSQLEYERRFQLPAQLETIQRRAEIFERYIEAEPEIAEDQKLQSTYYSLTNQLKAQRGQLAGLNDPYLMARRQAAERNLMNEISAVDTLRARYGNVLTDIRDLQQAKESVARRAAAFTAFGSILDSQILTRALYGYVHSLMRQRGLPQAAMDEMRDNARETEFYPAELEIDLLEARLAELRTTFADSDPGIRRVLGGGDLRELSKRIVSTTALADSLRSEEVFESGYLGSGDVTVEFMEAIGSLYLNIAQQMSSLGAREDMLVSRLATARLAVYGEDIPPDASFSLRIADGVVAGYPYNGTMAPANTTFFGLYDRHHSHTGREDWQLPQRWLDAEDRLDLTVPVNLVTTNDITGGNSGSPLLNSDLEIVGLVFDSNIDALPNEYIYLDQRARAISVDARAIIESLRSVYDAEALVNEILTGRLAE